MERINIIISPIGKKKFEDKIKMLKEIAEIVRKYDGMLLLKAGDMELGWF